MFDLFPQTGIGMCTGWVPYLIDKLFNPSCQIILILNITKLLHYDAILRPTQTKRKRKGHTPIYTEVKQSIGLLPEDIRSLVKSFNYKNFILPF